MAQTFLNLAQGVTGTLPNANFSGGKIAQVISGGTSASTSTTSSSFVDTNCTVAITPSATDSKVYFNLVVMDFL